MSLFQHAITNGIGRIFSLPRLSIPLILTLGLTLGSVLTVIAISNTLLFKPLQGVANENEIQTLEYRLSMSEELQVSYWNFRRLADFNKHFGDLGTWAGLSVLEQEVTIDNVSYPTTRYDASNTVLQVLGTQLLLGDDVNMDDPENYIWISYSLWQQAYAAQPSVIGKQLTFENVSYTIAGVIEDLMAVTSDEPVLPQQIWTINNLSKLLQEQESTNIANDIEVLLVKGNSDNITMPSKSDIDSWLENYVTQNTPADVGPIYMNFIKGTPKVYATGSYRAAIIGDSDKLIFALFAAVIGLLLMAAINLLNLFLAHYQTRTKEFAIQLSIGASLARMRLLVFVENLPLFLLAAITGVLVAGWIVKSLPLIAGNNLPFIDQISLDATVVLISLLIIAILNVVFSALSLVDIDKVSLISNLSSSGKGVQAQSNQTISKSLMILQLAIASILLTASVMLALQSFQAVYRDLGYNYDNTYEVQAYIEDDEYALKLQGAENYQTSEAKQLHDQITGLIEQEIQGSRVVVASMAPLSSSVNISVFSEPETPDNQIMYQRRNLSADFFEIFDIPFLAGTNLTERQIRQNEPRIVIDENMAKSLHPDLPLQDVIGKTIRLGNSSNDEPFIITGIVPTTHSRAGSITPMQIPVIYRADIGADRRMSFTVNVAAGQTFTTAMISDKFAQTFPMLSNLQVRSLDTLWENQTLNQRVNLYVVLAMTALTIFLAAIGISGLTQMTTNHRKYELAVRMATGAKQSRLVQFILKDALWMLVIGLGIGFILSVFGYREIQSQLDLLPPFDWQAMVILDIGLITIVVCSVLIPAWRVVKQDPMKALRTD
ncbi:ABC transporter permease [Thalassotalea fusca]